MNEVRTVPLVGPQKIRFGAVAFSPSSDAVYFTYADKTSVRSLLRVPVVGGEPRFVLEDIDSPPGFTADGTHMAFIRAAEGKNQLLVARSTGSVTRIVSERKGATRFRQTRPAWSPDGRRIAAAARVPVTTPGAPNVALLLFDAQSGRELKRVGRLWLEVESIAWRGDVLFVTAVADANSDSQVHRVSSRTGQDDRLTVDPAAYYDVTATADGKALVTVRGQRLTELAIIDDHGQSVRVTPDRTALYRSVSAGKMGALVTVSNASGASEIWSIQPHTGETRRITEDGTQKLSAHACPGGDTIVYAVRSGDRCNIWRVGSDGRSSRALTEGAFCDTEPQCSPDGRNVLFRSNRSGRLSAWKLSLEGGTPHLIVRKGVCLGPAWSPNGRFISCTYAADEQTGWTTAVFDAAGAAAPVHKIPGIAKDAIVRWHPSGSALLFTAERNRATGIWRAAIGSTDNPRQVLRLQDQSIFDFTPLGTERIALVKGTSGQDAVLLTLMPE